MSNSADDLLLETRDGGVALAVKAQPGAKRNALTGVHAGALKVAVSVAPEQGKANQAIAALLAETLGLKKSDVELLAGQTSRSKKFLVRGLSVEELRTRLSEILAGGDGRHG
ncbi:MAG TPA: DUF167 domain-containing protein [Pirellulaceae bacterium]|nr:DUF167 domain-containing protein [Pirellulaceae bacterium]